jgi:hypothetical protein
MSKLGMATILTLLSDTLYRSAYARGRRLAMPER